MADDIGYGDVECYNPDTKISTPNMDRLAAEGIRLTVAGMLKGAGYDTACIGKWHIGLGFSAKPGTHFDFDAPLPWPANGPAREDEEKIDFMQPPTGGRSLFSSHPRQYG
jgi:arylsulfatase A